MQEVAGVGEPLDVDPASDLFFQFAAPLLMTAETEEQFASAAGLAEMIWAITEFDAPTQAAMLAQFADESGLSDDQFPWLLDIVAELAARKQALLGE